MGVKKRKVHLLGENRVNRADERKTVSRDITRVLNAADAHRIPYRKALGFFTELDWQQIGSGVYDEKALLHIMEMLIEPPPEQKK